jgi:hypothetical protein
MDLYADIRDDEDQDEEPTTNDENYIRKKISRSRRSETNEQPSENLPFDLNDLP